MKLGNFKNLIFFFAIVFPLSLNAADKIETIPLVNLEKLSPTFEEDKDALEKLEKDNINLDNDEEIKNIIKKK